MIEKPANSTPTAPQRFSGTGNLPLHATVLACLVFVAYWNSLESGFHFDDQGIFLDPYIVGRGFGWEILRFMQTRPLTFLTFHWNYLAGGHSPYGFHLVNVGVHAANAVLVLLIARRVLRGSLALLAAALFAIHPLQTQAVNYVFERATLLAAFFALASLLLFLDEKYPWSIGAFGLSLLAKEETIALPAFLLLVNIVCARRRICWRYYAAMTAVAAVAAARLFYVLHAMPEAKLGFGAGMSSIDYALTQSRVIWIYLRLFFLPTGLNLQHDVRLSESLLSPPTTLPALALLVLLIGALVWLAWRRDRFAVWALGFFILLSPNSSIVPVGDLIFEHRVYFPFMCLTLAAGFLLARVSIPWRTPIAILVGAALLAGTIVRNRDWRDERSLWADVVKKSPGKALGYFQLGQAHASDDPERARHLYERGLELEPRNPIGHANLGHLLLARGDAEAALRHFRESLAWGGEQALVWNNIGAAQLRRGEVEEGINSFRRALDIDPCRFDARMNLMRSLVYQGKRESALLTGRVPSTCRLTPGQIEQLEAASDPTLW